MINVIDEVLSGEPIYYIRETTDGLGNKAYKIELATNVTTAGTPLNKALFDSIDYDIKNIPNFVVSKSYTDTFNNGTTKDKTIQLSNDRFFIIKTFIDESFVSPSYRYTKQGVLIFDAKTKQYLIYYAPHLESIGGMGELSLVIYRQGQAGAMATNCELTIKSFNDTTRELVLEIVAHGASNSQVTWTFEASSLDGKF